MDRPTVNDLVGRTFVDVVVMQNSGEPFALKFIEADGGYFLFYHEQDCCESVYIESIVGDLTDLVGEPLLRAEESTSRGPCNEDTGSTWTFYKFATRKGYVDVRWLGESNGYYSESVDLAYHPKGQPMTTINTSFLTGAALDWAVARAEEGEELATDWHPHTWTCGGQRELRATPYSPSTNWSQGGPIIEREWIEVVPWPNEHHEQLRWRATQHDTPYATSMTGPTPLIAAMRCFVASHMGDTLDIPEELA